MNIFSVHVNIPSFQTNKSNYKPSSFYQYENIVRRKLTLKINAGNDKDSFNVALHKMKWKSTFDIKIYYGADFQIYIWRQAIKYMGKVLSNKYITFEDTNSKSDMTFDIAI